MKISMPNVFCIEVQSELYVVLDKVCISRDEFDDTYEMTRRTRAAILGFINDFE